MVYWWLIVILFFILYLVYMCWHFRVFSSQGIPVPFARLPVVGTSLPMFRKGMLLSTDGIIEEHGKTTGGFMGRVPTLLTIDFDIIRQVFVKEVSSFPARTVLKTGNFMNDLMLPNIEDYSHWKYMRSTISPTFTSGKIKRMFPQINKCAQVYRQHLLSNSQDQKAVNIMEFAGSFKMDSIASTSFGLDLNTAEDRNNPFVVHAKTAFAFTFADPAILIFAFAPFLMPVLQLFKYPMFGRANTEFFKAVANKILDAPDEDDEMHVDLLKMLKKSHKEVDGGKSVRSLTREEILAQSLVFFLAGYDGTTLTISYLAYNLALNPDKQNLLLDEIDAVMGENEEVTEQHLLDMPYLDMCVSESLRLYPPASRIDRIASRDVVVKGIKLPKGAAVLIPVYQLHRNAELWTDPDSFIPERFTKENKAGREPLSYMPFGAGPRQCVGNRLALQEVKIATVHILRTHRFVSAPETEFPLKFDNLILLQPVNGIWLRVEPRI